MPIRCRTPNSSSGVSQKFNGTAGRVTGGLQLSLGIGSIVVAIAELVLPFSVGVIGMGIWASVLVSCHYFFSLGVCNIIVPYTINTFAMTWKSTEGNLNSPAHLPVTCETFKHSLHNSTTTHDYHRKNSAYTKAYAFLNPPPPPRFPFGIREGDAFLERVYWLVLHISRL